MKIHIGPYIDFIGPYQIAEKIFFWIPKYDKDNTLDYSEKYIRIVHRFGSWLAGPEGKDSLLLKFCNWIYSKRTRKIKVKIDKYDTWSMDQTLAHIILPMLKQLKDTKHGSHIVDLEDVPYELRADSHEPWDEQQSFDFYKKDEKESLIHERWDWVMNEMIFAFEHLIDDSWEENFRSGVMDTKSVPCEWDINGKPTMFQLEKGPNDTYVCDYDGMAKVYERMHNGFRLFGRYYSGLWD